MELPDSIPNSEVKRSSAENTCTERNREDRSLPGQSIHRKVDFLLNKRCQYSIINRLSICFCFSYMVSSEYRHNGVISITEGSDGVGKNTLASALRENLFKADEIIVDGEVHGQHDIVLTEATFPFYPFPSGDIIRLSFLGLATQYANERGLSLDQEINLRTALFALDRALYYAAREISLHKHKWQNHYLIESHARSEFSQIHTIAGVYHRRGIKLDPKSFDYNKVVESDKEMSPFYNKKLAVLLPRSVSDTKISHRNVENIDELEQQGPQEIAIEMYSEIADKHYFGAQRVEVHNPDGTWRPTYDVAAELLLKMGIDVSKRDNRLNNLDRSDLYPVYGGVYEGRRILVQSPFMYLESFLHSKPANMYIMALSRDNKLWQSTKDSIEEDLLKQWAPNEGYATKKDVLRQIEVGSSRSADAFLKEARLDEKKLDLIPDHVVDSIVSLFGAYTEGQLLDFIKYILINRRSVMTEREVDFELRTAFLGSEVGDHSMLNYGEGYLLFLYDILKYCIKRQRGR